MSSGPASRLFRVFDRPRSAARAVHDEIEHHLATRAEMLMETEGLSREAAFAEARRRFGDIEAIRRQMEGGERQMRKQIDRTVMVRQTTDDVKFALRSLRKSPGLALVVILTLTIGIGLNTAIFSIVKGVLLDPLPYANADRLVWAVGSFSGSSQAAVSPADYLDYRSMSTSFEYLGGQRGIGSYTLTGGDTPEILRGHEVTAEFFEALGATPILGRGFSRYDEETVSRIVVLGHTFWQTRFGGRADALGQTLMLDGEPYEVVGVMPAGFQLFSEPDFFLPIPLHVGDNLIRRFHNLRLVGLLEPGVSIEA
ncbi:MAG: ABC transporter permease, partial [Gemmatimonadetes bacterium]|nr:ABC transporter permease [Gemmatimonadota bacterium]